MLFVTQSNKTKEKLCFLGAPCLSFDILQDSLGEKRETFPLTCYCVSGSQSEHGHLNHVIVMKMENLHRTTKEKKEETD
jgi:ribosome assembly protein RRB1